MNQCSPYIQPYSHLNSTYNFASLSGIQVTHVRMLSLSVMDDVEIFTSTLFPPFVAIQGAHEGTLKHWWYEKLIVKFERNQGFEMLSLNVIWAYFPEKLC